MTCHDMTHHGRVWMKVLRVQMVNRQYRVIRTSGGRTWDKANGSPAVAWSAFENLDAALDKAMELAHWTP